MSASVLQISSLDNSSHSVEMCRQMASAAEEQRSTSRYITRNIESITETIRSIQKATEAHEVTSASVAGTFTGLLENARRAAGRLPELASAIEELRARGEAVSREVTRFGDSD